MYTLYTFTTPVFIKTLGGLKAVLAKAEAHVKEKGIDEKIFLGDQLIADMFPLAKQVEIACDNAKNGVMRLTGVEAPKFADNTSTFAELNERIDKTLEYLQSVPEGAFAGAEDRQAILPYFPGKYMTGFDYAREYALPNFFFHTVTAYGIIRKNGVAIGKADYINGMPLRDLAA